MVSGSGRLLARSCGLRLCQYPSDTLSGRYVDGLGSVARIRGIRWCSCEAPTARLVSRSWPRSQQLGSASCHRVRTPVVPGGDAAAVRRSPVTPEGKAFRSVGRRSSSADEADGTGVRLGHKSSVVRLQVEAAQRCHGAGAVQLDQSPPRRRAVPARGQRGFPRRSSLSLGATTQVDLTSTHEGDRRC
jgi:hypothetical protein